MYIKCLTLDDIEVGMYDTAGFGPLLARLLRLRCRWRQRRGRSSRRPGRRGFGCETEMWIGEADDFIAAEGTRRFRNMEGGVMMSRHMGARQRASCPLGLAICGATQADS